MKYLMSNFDIFAIISEIQPRILNSWVQKIYQIENIFILKFRAGTEIINLLIETPERIHITEYERVKPKFPPKFCEKLRKTIKNLRVCDIYQRNFDRVVVLELGYFQVEQDTGALNKITTFKIIFEFFDKGNVILLDENDLVISALYYKTMRDRRILPKRTFSFPPSHGQNIINVTFEEFKKIMESSKQDLIPTLVNNLNIGPIYAQEICIRANINPNISMDLITEKEESLFTEISKLLELFKQTKFNPQIILKNSDFYAISPIDLKVYQDWEKRQYDTINKMADEFYSLQEETIEIQQVQKEISESTDKIGKLDRILNEQNKQVQTLHKKAEKSKRLGDLIYQNFSIIQQLLDFINNSRKNNIAWDKIISTLETKKKDETSFAKILEKSDPTNAMVELKIDNLNFDINFTTPLTKIANDFYQQSKKMLRKAEGAKNAIQDTLKKLELAKIEEIAEKPIIDKPRKQRVKKWFEKFHWLFSSEGFLIIGGKDLKSNETLVKKYMNDNDIFIHASFQGAPAVILRTEGGTKVSEESISEAAQLAITYSNAWNSGYSQADAFWVSGSQVTFSPPSGEFRQKGSFIIKGTKNILKSIPAKILIGFKIEDDFIIPVISANKEQKDVLYPVEIVPGDVKSSFLAKEIKAYWISKVDEDLQKKIKRLDIDEIQRLIPAGKGKII